MKITFSTCLRNAKTATLLNDENAIVKSKKTSTHVWVPNVAPPQTYIPPGVITGMHLQLVIRTDHACIWCCPIIVKSPNKSSQQQTKRRLRFMVKIRTYIHNANQEQSYVAQIEKWFHFATAIFCPPSRPTNHNCFSSSTGGHQQPGERTYKPSRRWQRANLLKKLWWQLL